MAKKTYGRNESDIERLRKQGCRQAIRDRFTLYFFVRHVPSRGPSHRALGRVSGQARHLLPEIEYARFLVFDRDKFVIDIREPFYLNPSNTTVIADARGFRHSKDPAEDTLAFVPTALVVTVCNEETPINKAFRVKPFSELQMPRIWEKQQNEDFYQIDKSVLFGILMERDVPLHPKRSLQWLREYRDLIEFDEPLLEYFTSLTKSLPICIFGYCTHQFGFFKMLALPQEFSHTSLPPHHNNSPHVGHFDISLMRPIRIVRSVCSLTRRYCMDRQ